VTVETIFYDEQTQKEAAYVSQQIKAQQEPALDRCLGEAAHIRQEIATVARMASAVLDRLAGPRPECDEASKGEEAIGGTIGKLMGVQRATLEHIADARRCLEQIGKYV
jgi:hypothetical protein